LHRRRVADSAREGERIGVKSEVHDIELSVVNSYKDATVGRLYKGVQGLVRPQRSPT
jgi:dihydrolipoamide dehydrogenase